VIISSVIRDRLDVLQQCTHSGVREVDHYVRNGSTVNICALDLSKAFDRINHHGLYIKLMKRRIPIEILQVIEHWFRICLTCVKW
jgi:hypothetical protein